MCVAHYDKNSDPVIPDRFEVFVDQSDSNPNDFIARVYRIDDWDDLCLIEELVYDFIPTLEEVARHVSFDQ